MVVMTCLIVCLRTLIKLTETILPQIKVIHEIIQDISSWNKFCIMGSLLKSNQASLKDFSSI